MNFLKKNWIIASCIIILLLCFCLIRNGISTFSYPKGAGTIMMLGIVFGSNLVFSKINKRFGDKYTRRLDRIFIHIAVPVIIFTSFGFFQKQQIKNAQKEMYSIMENRIQGQMMKKKNYDQMAYGELTPFLQLMNDIDHARAEKEEEYLCGADGIYDMINPENLSDKQSRDSNKIKLDNLLQGVEKYSAWIHSEMPLIEKKIKNLGYGDKVLQEFRKSSKISLSMNDELMDAYNDLIISIKKIIEFIEEHQNKMTLVNGNIEWNNEMTREKFAHAFESTINNIDKIAAIDEEQTEYQQQILKKINT